jgi:large subunit ribosomal protein L21
MYAVIRTGGKQHKVQTGDVIEIELVRGDGDTVTFKPLLVVEDDGTTHAGKEAERASVSAKLLGEQKGDKIHIFKYKNKSGYSRRQGHRQTLTLVEIGDITLGSAAKKAPAKAAASGDDAAADAGSDG